MDGAGEPRQSAGPGGVLTGALGGAVFALAGHLALLRAFGTVLPFRDQWKCTGVDLAFPWAQGQLGWRNFFAPLNDHWPVLTRLLSFALLRLNGQWNNLVETCINALLFAAAAVFFLRQLLPVLKGWTRPAFALLAGIVLALPITWENTLWGIQSLVYLQIALSLVYLASIATERTFSAAWWVGQIAGAVVLLTQHSGILAQVAAAVLLAWRWWRHDGDRRVAAAGLGLATAAVLLFAAFFPAITVTAALKADSWEIAADVFLRQLAWPLPHPAWAFFVYLPWLICVAIWLSRQTLNAHDAFILVGGIWVGAQAAAIGYGRGAETYTFASRYCDFLALGFLLNAACLVRLWSMLARPTIRVVWVVFAIFWLAAPIKSFWWESTESHAGYNLSRRPAQNARNLARLKNYFATRDPAVLSRDGGDELYPYLPEIVPLLAHPKFESILPPETGAPGARPDHGRLGWLPAVLLGNPWWLFGAASLLLAAAAIAARRGAPVAEDPVEPGVSPVRAIGVLAGVGFVASMVACAAWQNPSVFRRDARLRAAFRPVAAGTTYVELEFRRGDDREHEPVDAKGAVETEPGDQRSAWYGTRLPTTPDFRGILHSQPIVIGARYLSVPFAGYPCANGNGLRWQIVNPTTHEEKWLSYVGPNPGVSGDFWTVDVAMYQGLQASLYLFDGREDAEGWVGVAAPAVTSDPTLPTRWRSLLRLPRADGAHRAFAGLAVVTGAILLALLAHRFVHAARRRGALPIAREVR